MHKILANTYFLGKDIIYLPECHSTNEEAQKRYRDGRAGEGSIIITDRQTAGRGQRGNRWFSEPGMNLTFSLVLTPLFLDASEQFGLNMAVALGIKDALSDYVSDVMVKWPNDIVHREWGKLGGILIENAVSGRGIEVSVVGVGLNINQLLFPFPHATSVALLAGAEVGKEEIFKVVITRIEKYFLLLKRGREKTLKSLYQHHLFRFGEVSTYNDGEDFIGQIIGISDQGNLIIEKNNQSVHHYSFKQVRFV